MLAAILRGIVPKKDIKGKYEEFETWQNNNKKYCQASIDTLNFAQSVASTSGDGQCKTMAGVTKLGGGSKKLSRKNSNKNYDKRTRGKGKRRRSKNRLSKLRRNRAAKRTHRRRR